MIWLQQVAQDAGFALRVLRRMPAFTATIILTLALGIGMTSAVFSVFNAVLLRPLSYLNPEGLVSLSMSEVDSPFQMEVVGSLDFLDWKEQSASFEHIVAYDLSDDPVIIDGQATQERTAMVSEGFWELTGVRPAQGRAPASGERDTLLVSYDGSPFTIIGVLPRVFPLHLPWPGWPGFEPRDVVAYRTVRIEPRATTGFSS